MFCPKCGKELSETPTGLMCRDGEMEITNELEKRLTECYILKLREPLKKQFSFLISGDWFCPQCGVPIREQDGRLVCSLCNLSINEFIYSLVEHHPHFDGVDKWF